MEKQFANVLIILRLSQITIIVKLYVNTVIRWEYLNYFPYKLDWNASMRFEQTFNLLIIEEKVGRMPWKEYRSTEVWS